MIFDPIRKLFAPSASKAARPAVPEGERYYVIGDIHGRLDLLEALVEAIERHDTQSAPADTTIVLLGDLVDRGPDSAGVIRFARDWQKRRKLRLLAGNHEEMFLESFEDKEVLRHFLKHGGRETILSYGIARKEFNELSVKQLFKRLPEIVPQEDRDFLASFEEMIVAGDYVFVHAGIDPATPLAEQRRRDMLWIRDRFLRDAGPFEKVVVHGHTIFDEVADKGHRIGIDTGAFRTGVLTALMLEGEQRLQIQAIEHPDGIKTIQEEEYA